MSFDDLILRLEKQDSNNSLKVRQNWLLIVLVVAALIVWTGIFVESYVIMIILIVYATGLYGSFLPKD